MEPVDPPILGAPSAPNPIAALRRFARPRAPEERCELCSAGLAEEHQHLLEPATRQLLCACDACAILFSDHQAGKYRRVPRRIESWSDFRMNDEQWNALGIPITLAFFFHSTPAHQVVALYPSPAGATEALLADDDWRLLLEENPVLSQLEPDVEALLVNRIRGGRDYYRAPIDQCFRLVGLIRTHWRGLYGGTEAWTQITAFFEELKARSIGAKTHA